MHNPSFTTLSYLPGYYRCECGETYISDFPFAKASCLTCGNEITKEQLTHDELDGFLYNLSIMADAEPGKEWKISSIAEFAHYIGNNDKVASLLKFFKDKGYIRYTKKGNYICKLEVIYHYLRIDYSGYSREQRLEMALELGAELIKSYSFEKYQRLMEICKHDIFYCDGENRDFYIEDEHFARQEED